MMLSSLGTAWTEKFPSFAPAPSLDDANGYSSQLIQGACAIPWMNRVATA